MGTGARLALLTARCTLEAQSSALSEVRNKPLEVRRTKIE